MTDKDTIKKIKIDNSPDPDLKFKVGNDGVTGIEIDNGGMPDCDNWVFVVWGEDGKKLCQHNCEFAKKDDGSDE